MVKKIKLKNVFTFPNEGYTFFFNFQGWPRLSLGHVLPLTFIRMLHSYH